jgi:hypothetical protein
MALQRVIFICMTIPLCGCVAAWGQSYHIELETPSSIVIKYDPAVTDIQAIHVVAEDHCQKFNKDAAPSELTKSGWAITTATFVCKNISATERANIKQREMAQQAREHTRAAQVRTMMNESARTLGDTYKGSVAPSYGNAASCPACQQGIQQGQQMIEQSQAEQQQYQRQQDMKALQQQIQQQQQQIDNERRDPLGGINGRWR